MTQRKMMLKLLRMHAKGRIVLPWPFSPLPKDCGPPGWYYRQAAEGGLGGDTALMAWHSLRDKAHRVCGEERRGKLVRRCNRRAMAAGPARPSLAMKEINRCLPIQIFG